MAVISGVSLLYRLATILAPVVRTHLLASIAKLVPGFVVSDLSQKVCASEWFLLYQLGKLT